MRSREEKIRSKEQLNKTISFGISATWELLRHGWYGSALNGYVEKLFTNCIIWFLINAIFKVKYFLILYLFYYMKILVVDDEKKFAKALAERLRLRGFEVTSVFDGTSALTRLQGERFDGVVLDLRLPDMDGIQILRQTRERLPDVRFVVLSGHATQQDFKTCMELGAAACFHKPAKISELAQAFMDLRKKE
jgi:CheY-like chemotaxis protein